VVWGQIARITDTGTAALVVEQNVDRALANASHVYVFVAGTNHVDGPAAEIAALDLAAIFLGQDEQISQPTQNGAREP
jgi:ABC-type branched-subunit amino acid transport system ATPase component